MRDFGLRTTFLPLENLGLPFGDAFLWACLRFLSLPPPEKSIFSTSTGEEVGDELDELGDCEPEPVEPGEDMSMSCCEAGAQLGWNTFCEAGGNTGRNTCCCCVTGGITGRNTCCCCCCLCNCALSLNSLNSFCCFNNSSGLPCLMGTDTAAGGSWGKAAWLNTLSTTLSAD